MMTEDVDLLLFLVDVEKGFGKGDKFILEKIKQENKPTFLLLNKVDRIKKEELFRIITELNELHDFKEIIPITSPFTFAATGNSILFTGAKAAFVDIDPETFTLDPALIEDAISENTKAIMPKTLFL